MAVSSDKANPASAGKDSAKRNRWTDWVKDNAAPFAMLLGLAGTVIGGFLWVERATPRPSRSASSTGGF